MIYLKCPRCGHDLKIPEKYLGKTGKCNHCGGKVTLVALPPELAAEVRPAAFTLTPNEETDPGIVAQIEKEVAERARGSGVNRRHFALMEIMNEHYKKRDGDPFALSLAIEASIQMIELAPKFKKYCEDSWTGPLASHPGFHVLSLIRENQGQLDEAIALCKVASAQGWNGDWEKRLERLTEQWARQRRKEPAGKEQERPS